MALTRSQLSIPIIRQGRVLDVDVVNYSMTVGADRPNKVYSWVSFATPYQHHENGEGIYFMPEIGSLVWICEPSTGDRAFVIGWASPEDKNASYRGRKMNLNPGDIYLGGRDENHVILRRGGVVEIGATPLSQRLYIPIDNVIKDICANYSLQTLGGSLEWSVAVPQGSKDGKRPTTLTLQAREYADDAKPVAKATIGSHGEGVETILSLVLRDLALELYIEKSGKATLNSKGAITWNIKGDVTLNAPNITFDATQKAALRGKVEAAIEGGVVTVKSTSGGVAVDAKAGMSVKTSGGGPALSVGEATDPVFLATDLVLKWLTTHTHPTAAPGPPSPPSQPLPPVMSKSMKAS